MRAAMSAVKTGDSTGERSGARAAWIIAAVAACAIGVAVTRDAAIALTAGAVLAVFLVSLGARLLARVLVASTYVTRPRLQIGRGSGPIGGGGRFHFLPEHLVVVVTCVAAVVDGQGHRLLRAAQRPAMILLGGYIAYAAGVSMLYSPSPVRSLAVVGWLGLSWLVAVAITALFDSSPALERQIVIWGSLAAVAAVGLFTAGRLTGHDLAVQPEHNTGGRALYGLGYEANILGSTLAVAAFIAITARRQVISRRLLLLVIPPMLLAIALSLTRAAVLGLLIGLAVWTWGSNLALRRVVPIAALIFVAALGVGAAFPTISRPVEQKFGQLFDTQSGTGRRRVEKWNAALDDMDIRAWILGSGFNSFGQRHVEPTQVAAGTPGYLSNVGLQVLYDTGLVGASLLLLALRAVWPRDRALRRRAAGLVAVFLVTSFATSTFWFGSTWTLVALALLSRDSDSARRTGQPASNGNERHAAQSLGD